MRRLQFVTLAALVSLAAAPAFAQLAPTGGAGNTGVNPPVREGGVNTRAAEPGGLGAGPSSGIPTGNAASPSNSAVPGTTPGVNIGGTPTGGPPGSGGTAGGISTGNQ